MKVCFVSHSALRGGSERSLLETVDALGRVGIECSAVLPSAGPLATALARRGVRHRILPYRWWMHREGASRLRARLRVGWNVAWAAPAALVLRRFGADVVYTNSITVCTGALAAALARKPHVWQIRELAGEHHGLCFDLGEQRSLRWIDRLSGACVVNSGVVAARYGEFLSRDKLRVIYPWVHVPDVAPPELVGRQRLRVVTVGFQSPAKRQEEAIAALALLVREGIDAELLLVGGGDPEYRRRLEQQIDAGLVDRVHFLGEVDEAFPVVLSADVLVVCSRSEAFGRVTIEGMLAGKPVVGARSAGTAELIEDGRNGFLYEPGDVAGLARVLRRLAEGPAEARRAGARAQAWASSRFTEQRYAQEVCAVLRAVTGSRPLDTTGAEHHVQRR